MAIATNSLRSLLAQYLVSQLEGTYFGIGKSSAWDDDATPDAENVSAASIAEPIDYIKADKMVMVKELAGNEISTPSQVSVSGNTVNASTATTITYNEQTYQVVNDADVKTEQPEYVYVHTEFKGTDVDVESSFRQIGLFIGLTAPSMTTVLKPTQIANTGTMIALSNVQPIYMPKNQIVNLSFLISLQNLVS